MELTRHQRIMLRKEQGSRDRHSRKLTRYSPDFEEMFKFFLDSYRKGMLNFAGVDVTTEQKHDGYSAKEAFKRYDTGDFNDEIPTSRQSNILRCVIMAKKSFGLHVRMWSEGIADGDFTIQEILGTFNDYGIKVPDSLLVGFENEVTKRKTIKNEIYLNSI